MIRLFLTALWIYIAAIPLRFLILLLAEYITQKQDGGIGNVFWGLDEVDRDLLPGFLFCPFCALIYLIGIIISYGYYGFVEKLEQKFTRKR